MLCVEWQFMKSWCLALCLHCHFDVLLTTQHYPDNLKKEKLLSFYCIDRMQRSFMADRLKASSWQKAFSIQAILPQLSIWRDFPATTWLKSLQQQHFISAHCEIDFTRLQFVSADQEWLSWCQRVLMSPKATLKLQIKGHNPENQMNNLTCCDLKRNHYKRSFKERTCCICVEHSKNVHSASKSHRWEEEKAIY